MKSAKQATLELVQDLPDEVSMDTILEKLAYLADIERGLAEAERGEVADNAQVIEELRAWRKSSGR
jgi:predicted transcriptional regulator